MATGDPVGYMCRRSNYGSGGKDVPKFIYCVDGRQLEIPEVWNFGEDGITREVRPTARVDVVVGFICEFSTD